MLRYLFPLLLIASSSFGQEENVVYTQLLQKEIDSLRQVKEKYESESDRLEKVISALVNQKLSKEKEALLAKGLPLYARQDVKVYSERGTWSDEVGVIPKGTTFMAYDYKSNYYFVGYDTINGYVLGIDAETLDSRDRRLELAKQKAAKSEVQAQQKADDDLARRNILIAKYGSTIGEKILNRKIWLGMSKQMAKDSWGTPKKINRSVGSWGVHEQWVYSNANLYFRDDLLNSWQE